MSADLRDHFHLTRLPPLTKGGIFYGPQKLTAVRA